MTFEAFHKRLTGLLNQGNKIFVSSSFQTHSIPLLHMISRIDKSIPVVFLNTGFLFPETLVFRDKIIAKLGLPLIDLRAMVPKIQQRNGKGNFYFTSDPDRCCYLNKVQPMEPLLKQYDFWINGIRADQSAVRKAMQTEQVTESGCIRFHPLLDWTPKMIFEYRKEFDLPEHPLEAEGYLSIGCEPCTLKYNLDERNGRWFGMNKSECGLHTDLGGLVAENS
ncbi:MAG: phosphoadenosine phosphosulfate reductase [Limisphaerales bacterium]